MNPHLQRLANRVAQDPAFLASALAAYAHSENADDRSLARSLGIPESVLVSLRLCRMPRSDAPHFSADVDRVAERFQVDADVLAEIVRRGQVLMKTRRAGQPAAPGALMAARDDRPAARRKKGGKRK